MVDRYYVKAPIPKDIESFLTKRIIKALHLAEWDKKGYMDAIEIPTEFHWTIKAPFKPADMDEYRAFMSLLKKELQQVNNVTATAHISPPFGDWNEEAIHSSHTAVMLKTIVMRLSFPHENELQTLGQLQTVITTDDLPWYTDLEQFNIPHITLLNNLHEFPLEETQSLYEIFYDLFRDITFTFEIQYIDVMKKFRNERWAVEQKIMIPYY